MVVSKLIAIVILLAVATPPAEGFSVFLSAIQRPTRTARTAPLYDGVEVEAEVEITPTASLYDDEDLEAAPVVPLFNGKKEEGDKAWKGGFIKKGSKMNYPRLTPDLSSLELMNNTVNIDKLDRMQKVRWPEFSWTRNRGDPTSRCYLRFYDNISRIGYTKEGRIYSIICPQMGVDLNDFGLPGTFNVEVHVDGTRGWVDEDTKTICGEMIVTGLIWIDMNDEERLDNPLTIALVKAFTRNGTQFPFTKESALVVPTHNPFENWNPIVPVRNGTTTEFPLPPFAQHWDGETLKGCTKWQKLDLFGVANIPSQVGKARKTGIPAVDDFNDILLEINNIALAGILTEGNVIDWNLWTTPPEVVNQTEYRHHSDDFRESINVHNKKFELDIQSLRNYEGKQVYARDLIEQFMANRGLFKKIKKYVKTYHPESRGKIRAYLWKKGLGAALDTLNPISTVDRLAGRILGRNVRWVKGVHAPRTGIVSTMRRGLRMDWVTSIPYFGYVFAHPFKTRMKVTRLFPFRQVIGWPNIVKKPKSPESLQWHVDDLIKTGAFRSDKLPEDYHFFGSMDTVVDELKLSLKTNPFFATALTRTPDGYLELNTYDPTGKNENRFLQLLSTLPDGNVGRRVNVRFNKDLTEIVSFTVYEGGENGTPSTAHTYDPKAIEDKSKMNDMAGIAIYNLLFYQAIIHSTFHALHYVMLQSWVEASRKYKPMKKWAKWYNRGILSLYFIQTQSLDQIFFTKHGYNADKEEGNAILKAMLDSFSKHPSADGFLSCFFQLSREEMDEAGILTEFFKHFDLIEDFSGDAAKALNDIDPPKFRAAQSSLIHKLSKQCGAFESTISNMDEFLQLLSVTSLIHGSTRTLARYFASYSVMRWNSPGEENWTPADASMMGSLSPGGPIHEGRHLMSIASKAGRFPAELRAVLGAYDAKSTKLKLDYQKELMKDPKFETLGFLLTDYCVEGFDGKQVTSCTYN